MEKSGSSKPLIRQGWLRAVLCFIGFLILSGASLSFYFVVLHKGNPDVAGLADLMNDNNLLPVTGIFFITALLVCFVFRHWVDRKSFASIGLDINGHEGEAVAGLMLATFIVCASSLLLKWTGHLKWMDILFDLKSLFLAFGTIALIAFYEEVIFRGYILSNLMESFSKWLALVISVLLFMSFHWTARSSSGFFSLANLLIIGLILGLNFIYTRNLWFSICFHIGWKFMEQPVFGYSGSVSFQALLQPELKGDETFTGGSNGLEGSVFMMAISLLSLVLLFLFLQKKLSPQSLPVPNRI